MSASGAVPATPPGQALPAAIDVVAVPCVPLPLSAGSGEYPSEPNGSAVRSARSMSAVVWTCP